VISNRRFLSIVFFAVVGTLIGCTPTVDRTIPPASVMLQQGLDPIRYRPHAAEEWTLPNGLTVLYRYDPELPLVMGTLNLRGGGLWGLPDERGVISAMGSQLRLGGAGELSPEQFDLEMERLSAGVATSFGVESGSISFSGLSTDFKTIVDRVADVTLRPQFNEARLNLWKGQALEGIARRKDDPGTVADISSNHILYGEQLYGRILSSIDIKEIERIDLLRAHRRIVRPDGAILAITGAVSRVEVESVVADAFRDWQPRGALLDPILPFTGETQPGVYLIEAPLSQATVMIAQVGIERLTPDYAAIECFNSIFGAGGFGSKLIRRIRSDLGLAYSTYGAVMPALGRGRNLILVQTKSASAGKAVEESLRSLAQMQLEEISPQELEETKRSIENSFLFRFDSIAESVQREATIRLLNYPRDYDLTYLDKIAAVSAADIQKVAQTRWSLDHLAIVVVGDAQALKSVRSARADPPSLFANFPVHRASFDEMVRVAR